jgi:threonine/homoserine/homoserine lactone efflux protein
MTPFQLSILIALAGLACFLWPVVQRLRGKGETESPESRANLRSPLWWAGFVLTALAIWIQRGA